MACFCKDSQNVIIQSLPLYTTCLFSMLLNDNSVDIEKPDELCSITFAVDQFSRLFLHPSTFFYYILKICINNKWCFIRYLVLIIFCFSVFRRHYDVLKIFIFRYFFMWFMFFWWRKNKGNSDNKNHIGI